jgi:glutathione synthase
MALKVAFQMDPIERIDIRAIPPSRSCSGEWRGVFYSPGPSLLRDGKLMAEGHSLTVEDKPGTTTAWRTPAASTLPRSCGASPQDPPFDMAYITTTISWSASSPRRRGQRSGKRA